MRRKRNGINLWLLVKKGGSRQLEGAGDRAGAS
jgi:hypothetical protein